MSGVLVNIKNCLIIVLLVIFPFLQGCKIKEYFYNKNSDLILNNIIELNGKFPSSNFRERYILQKTENYHLFLKLDTATGEIQLVQASMDKHEGIIKHSDKLLYFYPNNIGRFKLFSTHKTYQFILLDSFLGDTYRIQWSLNDEYPNVRVPIN